MEIEVPIVVTIPFKMILKELLEKFRLPPAIYSYEKGCTDHQTSFLVRIDFEDKFERHTEYGYKAYTKKDAENDAALRMIRHFKWFHNVIIKDVNE